MNESAMLILAIFGAIMVWTTSVIGGMLWLNAKFRSVEQTIYRELDKHRQRYDSHIYQLETKIQRLELRAFGFTGDKIVAEADDGRSFPSAANR